MKYHIDTETADNICKDVLRNTIKQLKQNIQKNKKQIKAKGSTEHLAWLEDIAWDEKYLEAAKVLYQYFECKIK